MAHMWPSDPRRQNSGPIFYPIYSVSLALLIAGGRGVGTHFVGSRKKGPSFSKLNGEGADLKGYAGSLCLCGSSSPTFLFVFLLLYVSLHLYCSSSLRVSLSLRLSASLRLHLPSRPYCFLRVLQLFTTVYVFIHRSKEAFRS